jgi:CRP-like cAMP-binding protein
MDLFKTAPLLAFSKGETLFRVGDPVRHLYLVQSGQLGLRRISLSGTEMLLQIAGANVIFAESSAYAPCYHCDGIALQDSECRMLPRKTFRARLAADPGLLDHWASFLAKTVQAARTRAEIRGLKTVAERLDMWLALGPQTMPPKGQWQTVAAELGVSREALYREVARRADRAAPERTQTKGPSKGPSK